MIDLTTYSDADLEVLRVQVASEIQHRNVLRSAVERSRELSSAYHQAADRGTPEGETPAWRQPTGAHDSYMKGHIRSHNGKIWESLRDGNTDEPGTGSWREKVEPGSPPALWVQPLGTHDAYSEGDYVTWPETNTHVWLNTHPGERTNVWEPGEFAAWEDQGPVEDWEPEEPVLNPEEPEEPEDPPPAPEDPGEPDTPVHPSWAPDIDVTEGDLYIHNGHLWKAKLTHKTHSGWEPSAAANTVWEDMGESSLIP